MTYDFSTLPFMKARARYKEKKYHLHSLTQLWGHCRETTIDYYNDGRRQYAPSHTVWQYTISGCGRLEKKNGYEDILPGTMLLLTVPGNEVYYLPETSTHWEFVYLTMVGEENFNTVKSVESRRGNIVPAEQIPITMNNFHSFIHKLFSCKIPTPFANASESYALCISLLEETMNTDALTVDSDFDDCISLLEETMDQRVSTKLASFEDLFSFLHENLQRDISVEEMASFLDMSRSHFTRLFTQNIGISPRRYLENLRLQSALKLLQYEGRNIKETANLVGIRDGNYFCRIFKKHFGFSPGRFKNKNYRQQ